MYSNQIKKLQPSAIGALTGKHLKKWDAYQLGALSKRQLQAIDTKALEGLKPRILEELVDFKGGVEFSELQREVFSKQQLTALNGEPDISLSY